jgi:hypothetical protein
VNKSQSSDINDLPKHMQERTDAIHSAKSNCLKEMAKNNAGHPLVH